MDDRLWIDLQDSPLSLEKVGAFLYHPRAGGVNIFAGTTRQWTGEQETVELSYECYDAMARSEMKALAEEACSTWDVVRVCMLHRLGVVPPAEASVIIGVATPHRGPAFEACRFLIDRLKVQVPIWKKEHYADGSTEWVQGAGGPAS